MLPSRAEKSVKFDMASLAGSHQSESRGRGHERTDSGFGDETVTFTETIQNALTNEQEAEEFKSWKRRAGKLERKLKDQMQLKDAEIRAQKARIKELKAVCRGHKNRVEALTYEHESLTKELSRLQRKMDKEQSKSHDTAPEASVKRSPSTGATSKKEKGKDKEAQMEKLRERFEVGCENERNHGSSGCSTKSHYRSRRGGFVEPLGQLAQTSRPYPNYAVSSQYWSQYTTGGEPIVSTVPRSVRPAMYVPADEPYGRREFFEDGNYHIFLLARDRRG